MLEKLKETAEFLGRYADQPIEWAVILGTGLGDLVTEIDVRHRIPYSQIPHFPVSTVEGHSGEMIFGYLGGKYIMALNGRFHYYEGYPMDKVTYPVRVMKLMGIRRLVVSNAAGGINPAHRIGDIMIIRDHINLIPEHPLRGKNIDELGPRFVDMKDAYNPAMIRRAKEIAAENGIEVCEGVYLALQGPTFETQAEYLMVSRLGGDAVGMSTVPEVIVARHMGIEVFGVSIITDLGLPGKMANVSHEEVQAVGRTATPKVMKIVKELIRTFE
ncbi:MAG TPA: purine-nucleoside phosphorylase [Candidatus Merdimorpha stercoravium]|uniref:Purine nucleoside phosphorylase n=1 Tax=Candidatus Merdimorpha stercoravium TaxID=2840863 RepID=A0A9D1H9G1_9FLAO|nr:purine-nucleoside phosphorylase [Candidatus Merdimorpha stercoravium]